MTNDNSVFLSSRSKDFKKLREPSFWEKNLDTLPSCLVLFTLGAICGQAIAQVWPRPFHLQSLRDSRGLHTQEYFAWLHGVQETWRVYSSSIPPTMKAQCTPLSVVVILERILGLCLWVLVQRITLIPIIVLKIMVER